MRIPSQIDLFIKATLQSIANFLMALNSIPDCFVNRLSFAPNDTGGIYVEWIGKLNFIDDRWMLLGSCV